MKGRKITMAKYNKFQEKMAEVEILTELNTKLNDLENYHLKSYEKVGEKQKVDWRTGEPVWADEEHTTPVMDDVYDYVPKAEFTEEDYAYQAAINTIRQAIEKLL